MSSKRQYKKSLEGLQTVRGIGILLVIVTTWVKEL